MEGLLLDWRLTVGFNCVGGVRKIELETKWSKPELMSELRYDIAWYKIKGGVAFSRVQY
jgi:hypothetical protein